MNTERLARAGTQLEDLVQSMGSRLQQLSDPARLARLRQLLVGLAAIWMVFALVELVWALIPAPAPAAIPKSILNPLMQSGPRDQRSTINIDQMVARRLFGASGPATAEAIAAAEAEAQRTAESEDSGELAGIENNAPESRLALTLTGVVASSDQDRARAIIEIKREQAQYAVGDKLPINGVKLAKILPDRVVIDNKGKYELLTLFDPNALNAISRNKPDPVNAARVVPQTVDKRSNEGLTAMAASYRKRLYTNPQSLAQVVNLSPEREGTQLLGYRLRPGRDSKQFAALGFKSNDIVTGVNGIALSDPSKAMTLYRVMKTATEASFEVLRDGQPITLMVGLDADPAGGSPSADSGSR